MFIHLSVSGKSSSIQLWFYVQTRHSLRPPLAENPSNPSGQLYYSRKNGPKGL